jgi:outer membrane lipoprotein-sorting protein
MRRFLMAGTASVLLVAAPVAAQTADEIIAKNLEAMGGIRLIKAVQTIRMTGRMTMGQGMEVPVTFEQKRPNMVRMEFTFQGMTGMQAFDGKTAWQVMPFAGSPAPQPMSADEAKSFEEMADMDGPHVDYQAKGNTVELVGKEAVEGADTYKLKVTKKDGTVTIMYIDAEHFLIIKQEGKRTIRGTEIEGETIISDYKDVNGLMVPHSLDMGQKGQPMRQKLTFDKVEFNVPIDDARFKMPK